MTQFKRVEALGLTMFAFKDGQRLFGYGLSYKGKTLIAGANKIPHWMKKEYWKDLKLRYLPGKVYFWYSSTDCDHMHVEHAVSFKNGRKYLKQYESDCHWADGPFRYTQITKAQYEECKNEHIRDDIAARMAGY